MILGHLVHARMVFPGKLSNVVNVSRDASYHIIGADDKELAITYTKAAADFWCRKLNGQRIEERMIFTQFPKTEVVEDLKQAA